MKDRAWEILVNKLSDARAEFDALSVVIAEMNEPSSKGRAQILSFREEQERVGERYKDLLDLENTMISLGGTPLTSRTW
jgi:hypothetical protein